MAGSEPVLTSSHVAEVALAPREVWSAISNVADYQSWWPWLDALDAVSLTIGETWRCRVRPPVPYRVAFQLHLDEIVVERLVVASLSGDIDGSARVEIAPSAGGAEIRLTAALRPASSSLRFVARWMAPVARFGHDWVISSGLRQFAAAAERPGGERRR